MENTVTKSQTLDQYMFSQDWTYYNDRSLSILDWWVEDGEIFIKPCGNDRGSVAYTECFGWIPNHVDAD